MEKYLFIVFMLSLFQTCTKGEGQNTGATDSATQDVAIRPEIATILKTFKSSSDGPDSSLKKVFIQLDPQKEEEDLQVQFYVGKYFDIDSCNSFMLNGKLISKDLSGYGYSYFECKEANIVSTLMHCDDPSTKKELVTTEAVFVDYNSKMPIVLSIPPDFDVYYRIWKKGEMQEVKKAKSTTDISMFPKAVGVQKQWVVDTHTIPMKDGETGVVHDKRLAFYLGETAELDVCNTHILGSNVNTEHVDGWGYDYFVITSDGISSTRRGCLDNTLKSRVVHSMAHFATYNKFVPIVLYTHKKHKVYTAIWKQGEQEMKAVAW